MEYTTDQRHDILGNVPSKGSERRSIRVPDTAAWEQFGRAVKAAGTDRSAAIRAFVDWLNWESERGPESVRAALLQIGMRLPDDET